MSKSFHKFICSYITFWASHYQKLFQVYYHFNNDSNNNQNQIWIKDKHLKSLGHQPFHQKIHHSKIYENKENINNNNYYYYSTAVI